MSDIVFLMSEVVLINMTIKLREIVELIIEFSLVFTLRNVFEDV